MSQALFLYYVCAGLGFTYIVGSALIGHFQDSDGGADGEGDAGDVDTDVGDAGDVDADLGDAGDVDADVGDAGDVDGGDSSDIDGGDAGNVDGHPVHAGSRLVQQQVATSNVLPVAGSSKRSSLTWYFKLIGLLSPTKLSVYLFCFGAVGVFTLTFFPFLGYLSTLPAALIGYGIGRMIFNLFSALVKKMHSSTNFKQDNLIGSTGELILSIEPGKLGEIVVSTGGSRHSAPARCIDANQSIKGLSKVVICDLQDGVFLVEKVPDEIE